MLLSSLKQKLSGTDAQQSGSDTGIKKGFIFKRGSSCLSRWKPKYVRLNTQNIALFEAYSDKEPKYLIPLSQIAVVRNEQFNDGSLGSQMTKLSLLSTSTMFPFMIVTKSKRKFYLATSSQKDCNEWISTIKLLRDGHSKQMGASRFDQHLNDSASQGDYYDDASYIADSDVESVYSHYTTKSRPRSSRSVASSRRSSARSAHSDNDPSEGDGQITDDFISSLRPSVIVKAINGHYTKPLFSSEDISYLLQRSSGQSASRMPTQIQPLAGYDNIYQNSVRNVNIAQQYQVVSKFGEACTYFCKRIIDKLHLRRDGVDGQQGQSDTFKYGDLLFNFAAIYDGAHEEEQQEIVQKMEKTVSNELLAVNKINSLHSDTGGVCKALLGIVDYLGFKVVCYPVMPLSAKSIVRDGSIDHVMDPLCKALNVTDPPVELHKVVEKQRIYGLNWCNILPIDHTDSNVAAKKYLKLRPEFVQMYDKQLPCKSDDEESLAALKEAHRHLVTVVIPKFAQQLDQMEILPIDSRGLSAELHKSGINIRYIGVLYGSAKLPYVRHLLGVEMISRVFKSLFRERIRQSVYHYRDIGAVDVHQDLIRVTIEMLNELLNVKGAKSSQKWSQIARGIQQKFNVNSIFKLDEIYLPHLLDTVVDQCGIVLKPVSYMNKDGVTMRVLTADDFIEFEVKFKHSQINVVNQGLNDFDRALLSLEQHIQAQPQFKKLDVSQTSALKLLNVAKQLQAMKMFDDALMCATSALQMAPFQSVLYVMIKIAVIELQVVKSCTKLDKSGKKQMSQYLDKQYQECRQSLLYHLSKNHPVTITLLDKMVYWNSLLSLNGVAYEYLLQSLEIAKRQLGYSHRVVAAYNTKLGYMLLQMQRPADALKRFEEALQYLKGQPPSSQNREAMAENMYSMAEAHFDIGDYDEALKYSHQSKQLRETLFGHANGKTADSQQQCAKILANQYANYDGIVTEKMQKDMQLAISLYEKVFKFIKTSTDRQSKDAMLLTLTKTLVGLKIRLIPSRHSQLLESIREQSSEDVIQDSLLKEVVIKLIHLSPTIYLEQLFQKLDQPEDRDDAIEELTAVLQVVEKQDINTTA
ncbi:hypothetical protein MIR68_005612 [Amoeboaphelidium protococcarum]|nr:hypothetical protein MIR68_005612 [Amoeboaphelidium protococcarum]